MWSRSVDLWYDVDATDNPLMRVEASSISLGAPPIFVQGDHLPLRIFLRRRTASGLQPVSIPSGYSMVFAAKAYEVSSNILFSAIGFVPDGDGDSLCYVADLDLNTSELSSALVNRGELRVRCDLEIQNPGNTRRITYQHDAIVRRQVYAGEGPPSSGGPQYPAPDQIALQAPTGGNYRIQGGTQFQIWNTASSLFESIDDRIQPGIRLVIEGGQVAIYIGNDRRVLL